MANHQPATTCSVSDCDRKPVARGLCPKHYRRLLRHGDPNIVLVAQDRPAICTVEGCSNPHARHGYCIKHYKRVMRHGDPHREPVRATEPTVESILAECEHDPETGCLIWRGGSPNAVLPRIKWKGRSQYVHRVMWQLVHNQTTTDDLLHTCGNRRCVNMDHLERRAKHASFRK